MKKPHDSSYKFLFSNPELVRDLIMGFIPDEWLQSLDYSTLEKMPCSYITEDLRERADDIVWRVKVQGDWVYLYLLIEFQSRVDKYMALRIMVYVGLLYQDLIKEGHVKGLLPPILPIVLYNGNQTWTAKTDIADLIPVLPPFLASFTPHLKYHLIAENAYSDTELASLKNLVAAVFRFEQFSEPTTIIELIGLLNDWLEDRPDLKRVFAIWIRATLKRKKNYAIVLPEVDDLQEIKVMFGDRLELWAESLKAGAKVEGKQEGRKEGRKEGRQEGEMLILQRLLAKRFGAIPADKISLISNASVDEIEHWADRVFDAKQLSDIFND